MLCCIQRTHMKKVLTKSSLCVWKKKLFRGKIQQHQIRILWGPENFEECKYLEHDKQIITTAAADKKHYRCMSEYRKNLMDLWMFRAGGVRINERWRGVLLFFRREGGSLMVVKQKSNLPHILVFKGGFWYNRPGGFFWAPVWFLREMEACHVMCRLSIEEGWKNQCGCFVVRGNKIKISHI